MKPQFVILTLALLSFTTSQIRSQGTFIYDQQSSGEGNVLEGGAHIQSSTPVQSFTPLFPSIDFIRLYLVDSPFGNSQGATLCVNLRINSAAGTILASTTPISLPDTYTGTVTFFFPSTIGITPGVTYFLQPVIQSGDDWVVNQSGYNYSGGSLFLQGSPDPLNHDLWFQEGFLLIPEPSPTWLCLLGGGLLAWRYRKMG
jgi:hypothetical protein